MTEEVIEKLDFSLLKIQALASSIKLTISTVPITASDWARIGYMCGQLSRCADNLTMDLIGQTHDLYNPIPGKKLSEEKHD